MAVGKNKRLSKAKKGGKKKIIDPFTRKEWYDLQPPSLFSNKNFGKTLVTRTIGTKLSSDGLKGRVFEVNLADLHNDDDQNHRKIKLICEEIRGKTCLTNFHGMDITRDKLCSMIRKWQTLIEASADVTTTDGYTMRLFCIGFTKPSGDQQVIPGMKYATHSQVRRIRKKMINIMKEQASTVSMKQLVKKFIPEGIGKEIEKSCSSILQIHSVMIRKVKILKKPKLDAAKLMEMYDDTEEVGRPLTTEAPEAANILTTSIEA